jgi:hypothetical protein
VTPEAALAAARTGRLYPSVILHGGTDAGRRETALGLARALLCEAEPGARPCGVCRHCRRIGWADGERDLFHPDFLALERDLKTSTSVEGARRLVQAAHLAPFEARGQVFAVASAETLTGEAANALLKALEEPGTSAPRNFLLLAPSQFDLLPTLRSRSLAVYLGAGEGLGEAPVGELAAGVSRAVAGLTGGLSGGGGGGAALAVLATAGALAAAGGWDDPRAGRPWAAAAAATVEAARREELPPALRRALLELAEALLAAPPLRLRGIPAERILEGLASRHLAPLWRRPADG